MPKMIVDPETYVSLFRALVDDVTLGCCTKNHAEWLVPQQVVDADGMVCRAEPATDLPLAQTYYVY